MKSTLKTSPQVHANMQLPIRSIINTLPIPAYLKDRIEPNSDGCWLWTGNHFSTGYALINWNGKLWKAHRLIWTLLNGPIPAKLHCCHTCDVKDCVNPEHIFLGTDKDNQVDKTLKGRHWQTKKTACPQGHPYTAENTYRPRTGGRKCKTCIASQRRTA